MKEKINGPDNTDFRINAGTPRAQVSIENETVQQEMMSLHPPTEDCTHHWKIETPAGETSMGICNHCGGTRVFSNSLVISQVYKDTLRTLRIRMAPILLKTNEPRIDGDL